MNRFSLKSMSLVLLVAIFGLVLAACTGPEGPAGPAGPGGADGAAGPAGPAGPAGSAGADGSDGADGENGAPGAPGAPGIPGVPGVDGDSSTAGVTLTRLNYSPDTAISDMVYLSGFLAGESVEVKLMASDSSASLGAVTANDGGMGAVELSHSGLPAGQYSVVAVGDGGGKASASFIVK